VKVRDDVNLSRLLVFDTDPALHELLAPVLQREGRSIQDAYDRHEALEALRHSECDLVLAGQGRNGDEGLKLLRRVRSIRPEARVILTGGRDPAGAVAAIRERAYAYFHKPIPTGPLADMVQLALDATAWRDDIRVASARPEWITLEVRCKIEAAERTTQFIREILADLEPQTAEDVAIAFRELLINGIEYGGKSDARKRVRASLLRTSRAVIAHIADPGKASRCRPCRMPPSPTPTARPPSTSNTAKSTANAPADSASSCRAAWSMSCSTTSAETRYWR